MNTSRKPESITGVRTVPERAAAAPYQPENDTQALAWCRRHALHLEWMPDGVVEAHMRLSGQHGLAEAREDTFLLAVCAIVRAAHAKTGQSYAPVGYRVAEGDQPLHDRVMS